jgi:hypothetical protein
VQGGVAANLSVDADHCESAVEVIAAAGADYTLPLDAGGYTTTGQAAGTLINRVIAMDAGNYTVTGQATGYNITYQPGARIRRWNLYALGANSRITRR